MVVDGIKTPLQMAKELYALQNNGKAKRGRKPVFSANQFYPWRVEREMEQFISEWLAENGRQLKSAALIGYDADGLDDVNDLVPHVPANAEEIARGMFDKANSFASSAMDSFSEKTVGRSIGYYSSDSELKDNFVGNFMELCKSASEDQKKDIANAVYRHRMFPDSEGKSLVAEINEINSKYSKSKAKFIARNETGNLNAAIQRRQIEGAGYSMYVWVAMPDGVTRDTHRAMNGMVCRWDDPTVYSDDGGKTWKKRSANMFIGDPGQDYNCRCTAVPFDSEMEDDFSVKQVPEEEKPDVPEIKETKAELVAKLEAETKRADLEKEKFEGLKKVSLKSLNGIVQTESSVLYSLRKKEYGVFQTNDMLDAYAKSIEPLNSVVNEFKKEKELDFLRSNYASLKYARPGGSRKINTLLWDNFKNAQKNKMAKNLSRWINKAVLQEDEVLLRATHINISDYEKGYFVNNGFLSTSVNADYVQSRLEQLPEKRGRYRAILFVEAKKGDKFAPPLIMKKGKLVGSVNETEKIGDFGQKFVFIKEKTRKGVDSVGEIMYFHVRVESR